MKKISVVALVILALGVASAAGAASITTTKHNFTTFTAPATAAYDTQICRPCHTPHNGQTVTYAPLWNHAATTQTFTPYASNTGTLDATLGQPDGLSKACLSCHDGTVAVDSYGGATGSDVIPAGHTSRLGIDLSNDHPISFTYDAALVTADGELNAITTNSGLGGTIATDMLFSGKMECASCHDVHGTPGIAKLLIKSNDASALCLTCHAK